MIRLHNANPRTRLATRLTAVALNPRSTPKMRRILQCVHAQIHAARHGR